MKAEAPETLPGSADPESLASEILKALKYRVGKDATVATPHDWLTASIKVVRDRIIDQLDRVDQGGLRPAGQARLLSVAGIPDRPPDARCLLQSRPAGRHARGAGLARRRPRRDRRARAGCRARQWRPRPARRLLHGEHGDRRRARPWLRHPLCQRHVPPGDLRRLAGRAAGNLARPRQSVGVRAPRALLRGRLRRLGRIGHRPRTAGSSAMSGSRTNACWPSPTTRRWSAGAASASTRCGCGRRCRSIRSCSTPSTPATTSARCARATRPKRCRACSIRPIRTRPARNCGCGRSISSPPPRCRTSCSAISASMATCMSLPDKAAIHLNDTHPAIAVAELMRLLMDVHGIDFDTGLGHHQAHLRLHQPHAAARGAGKLAGAAVRAAAAAPHADHLRDQRRGPARGARDRPASTTSRSAASR